MRETIICAREGCGNELVKRTHNQKYCSSMCCKIATNAKIMEKYYEKRDRRMGKERRCRNCDSKLSRYNETRICSKCQAKKASEEKESLLEMLSNVRSTA